MALIKCPECNHSISSQADICPHCGYELNERKNGQSKENTGSSKRNWNYKYLLVILVLAVGAFLIFSSQKNNNTNNNDNKDGGSAPSTTEGFLTYTNKSLDISFDYPNTYKTMQDNKGNIYVGKNIDNQGALIPYIIIGVSSDYSNCVQFLNAFTDALRENYGDVVITIDMLSNYIGNNLVYGIQYKYTSSGHVVIDNRYATLINNKVYMVGTREENTNTEEMNTVAGYILTTLKGGN